MASAQMTNRLSISLIIRAGVGDAVWQTQINGLYGLLFRRNKEAAFSNYRLWESAGFVIAYAYSTTLCARMKLYLLFGNLVLGVIGYVIVEIRHRRKVNFPLNRRFYGFIKFSFFGFSLLNIVLTLLNIILTILIIFLSVFVQERRLKKQEAKENAAREAEAAKQQEIEETDDEKDDLEEDIEVTHF